MSKIADLVSFLPQWVQDYIIHHMVIPDVHNDPSKVQLARIAHVYFEHGDLRRFEKFAHDFGFFEEARNENTIYYRGYSKDPYIYVASKSPNRKSRFKGAAFVARDAQEFEKAAALPGAVRKTLKDAPGGGELVTFARPNGTFMHVVYGQHEREVPKEPLLGGVQSAGAFNGPFDKPRLGKFQRFEPAPSPIHKLGHFGYICKELAQELEFYTSNFNFVHSDILRHDKLKNVDVVTFMHLDLGEEYGDHHVIFLTRAPPGTWKTHLHHTSYEISDLDTQLLGHQWLASQKWKSVWGVGRHIIGSQIFDYWLDSSRFRCEHYIDSDVVNSEYENRRGIAGPMFIWGPEMPGNFSSDPTS
jgi:hypothetical protein